MSVGENIKKYRIANGMTQQELAEKLGYSSKSTVFYAESGRIDLPTSKLKEYANVLKVPVSTLLEETPEERKSNEILRIFACLKKCDDKTIEIVKKIIGYSEWQKKAAEEEKAVRINYDKN